MQNIVEIERLCHIGWDEIKKSETEKRAIDTLYIKELHTSSPPCCDDVRESFFNKIESYYQTLNPNFIKPQKIMSDSKYQLKPEMQLYTPSTGDHVTPENQTDELCIEALAENEGRIVCFSSVPKNWKADVADFKAAAEKEAKAKLKDAKAEEKSAAAENTKAPVKK